MYCPKCNAEYNDFDGFGVLYCPKCRFCTHASVTGGICSFCKKEVHKACDKDEKKDDGGNI